MKTITIILALLFMSCAAPLTYEEKLNADFGYYPVNYQQRIQDYMSQGLYDPYSAVYYFGTPSKAKAGKTYGYEVPVDVNAKNRMGGYVGKKRYCFMFYNDRMWRTAPYPCGLK